MRWTDFLRPERACAVVAKLFLGLFVFILVAELARPALSRMQLPAIGSLGMVVGVAIVSGIAYVIREHRKGEHPRPRSTRGAERTPLLPHMEEDA